MRSKLFILMLIFLTAAQAFANTAGTPTFPLKHCYHWLSPDYLNQKYPWAANNAGELAFFLDLTGGRGNAGAGLYCAKSPSGSASYGSRLIRIDLVDDVVVEDRYSTNRKFCGAAVPDSECQQRKADITYYSASPDWFVIRTPDVIARWTTASAELIDDLTADRNNSQYLNDTKISSVTAAIKSDIAAKGELIFYNGKARMALNELFNKDPNKILKMSPASVLSLLGTLKPGQSDDDLLEWALESSISRILAEKDIHWPDLEPIFRKNGDFRHLLIYRIRDAYFKRADKKIANTEVLLNIANLAPEELPRELIDHVAVAALRDMNPSVVKDFKLNSAPLRDALNAQLEEWIEQNPPAKNLKNFLVVHKFAVAQKLNSVKLDQAKQTLFPQNGSSGLSLFTNGTFYPLGSDPKEIVNLCEAQIVVNGLATNSLSMGSSSRNTLVRISAAMNADPLQLCKDYEQTARQILNLLPKNNQIFFVRGDIQGTPFVFAVEDPDGLRTATDEFVKAKNITLANHMSAAIDGGRSQLGNNTQTNLRPDEIAEAMVNLGQNIGIYSKTERDYISSYNSSNKPYKILVASNGRAGVNPQIRFTTNSLDDFEKDCLQTKTIHSLSGINSATYTLSGVGSGSFYLNSDSTDGVCAALHVKLAGEILSEQAKQKIASAAKYPFALQLLLPATGIFPMGVSSLEEVREGCVSELGTLTSFPSALRIKLKDGNIISVGTDGRSLNSVCNAVVTGLQKYIPSAVQAQIEASKGKFRLKANVNNREYTFVVNDKNELRRQCLKLVPDAQIERMYWKFENGGGYLSSYNSIGYWKTSQEICEELVRIVELK